MVYAFLVTKGGQQVPQPKSKAKARTRSREMMSEGAEQTPDASRPRLQPERSAIVFVRGETLEPRLLAQKCEYHGKVDRRVLGILRRNDHFLFYLVARCCFFLRREILHGPLCKDDTCILFFEAE